MGFKQRGQAKGMKATGEVRQAPRVGRPDIIVPGQHPRNPTPIQPIVNDSRPEVPAMAGASQRDLKEYSESEPKAVEGLSRTIENSKRVAKLMAEKVKKEGKVIFTCPFCRAKFETQKTEAARKAACAAHIKAEHPMGVKAKKLEKAPKDSYEPRRFILPPLLNPADFAAPEHKRFYDGLQKYREESAGIRSNAVNLRHGTLGGHFNVKQYMIKTEHSAIEGLDRLSTPQVNAVLNEATNKGKRMLAKACRKRLQAEAVLSNSNA